MLRLYGMQGHPAASCRLGARVLGHRTADNVQVATGDIVLVTSIESLLLQHTVQLGQAMAGHAGQQVMLQVVIDMVGAEVLITDDQDGFKSVADESGVSHQICRQHVTRNVLDFVAKTAEGVLKSPPRVPTGSDLSADQLLDDLALLEWIMLGQPSHAVKLLEEGVASAEDIDRACQLGLGHPMGPLKLIDITNGVELGVHASDYLRGELGERFAMPSLQRRMAYTGQTGLKAGKGFYDYSQK